MFFLVCQVVAKCVARRNFINVVLTEVHEEGGLRSQAAVRGYRYTVRIQRR